MTYNPGNEPKGYRWLIQQVSHQGDKCLIWPFSCCTPGYGVFNFEYKRYMAHRFMCEQKNGPPPTDEHLAAHSCGNRRCVNPNHLGWKTHVGNQLDRREHGTNAEKRTKLTRLQAMQIRQLRGIETSIETAARYGITESNVRLIQDGITWKEVGRKVPIDLTADQVRAIRKSKEPVTTLARSYGLSTGAIYRVRSGASYKTVV